jgi:hypothetical protein
MNDGRSLWWIGWALVPAYLLLVKICGKWILKTLPEGKVKRLLSLRIGSE